MTIELEGNWTKGRAYDVHTLSSTYLGPNELGHDQYESIRSEMGELVYKLKYKQDKTVLPAIVTLLDKIKGIEQFDFIIPIPATKNYRSFKPVDEIAMALGGRRGVRVLTGYLVKSPGSFPLKNVKDAQERLKLLEASLSIEGKEPIEKRNVLLVDDLYRSGATLLTATRLLLLTAKVAKVCVLTMTKTRSNR